MSDCFDDYSKIGMKNERRNPFLSFIYGKASGHLVRLSGVLHVLNVSYQLMLQYEGDIYDKVNSEDRLSENYIRYIKAAEIDISINLFQVTSAFS